MSAIYPSDLSDAEWECLTRHLPVKQPRGRPCGHPLRAVLDAIFYLLRTGCPWRYLPRDFPPWQTVYYHFRRFRLDGTWHHLLAALRTAERCRVGKQPQPSAAIMDAQSIKTVGESASSSGDDGHKRVKGRKRHLLVDTLGLPISISVTPADAHDTVGAWRRSGRTGGTRAGSWRAGASTMAAGMWRSSAAIRSRGASRSSRGGGWSNGVSPGWCATAA